MNTPSFVIFQQSPEKFRKISQKKAIEKKSESLISKVFFSKQNQSLIQKYIIMQVFEDSDGKYLIEPQNSADIMIIMKAIYMSYVDDCNKLPTNTDSIKYKIKELDMRVVAAVVPDILAEIDMNQEYLRRRFGPMELLDLPKNMSRRGFKNRPNI